ncbi:MAG: hypothetical protein ABFS56_19980 [Pseudomonadota bacterium]
MFKAVRKSVIIVALLLINMAIFTLCVNQLLKSDETKRLANKLIDGAQAKLVKRETVTPPPKLAEPKQLRKPNQLLALQFDSTHIHLNESESAKLEIMLKRLHVSPFHSVKIFSGKVPDENNIPFPQTAKLRAQNVARVIYPFTQTVKMHYRPSLPEGKTVVEFMER